LCNEDSLLPLSATTAGANSISLVSSTTTLESTKKEPTTNFIKGTTDSFSSISSAELKTHEYNMMASTLLTFIIYFTF